jgi:hypothetical protein
MYQGCIGETDVSKTPRKTANGLLASINLHEVDPSSPLASMLEQKENVSVGAIYFLKRKTDDQSISGQTDYESISGASSGTMYLMSFKVNTADEGQLYIMRLDYH